MALHLEEGDFCSNSWGDISGLINVQIEHEDETSKLKAMLVCKDREIEEYKSGMEILQAEVEFLKAKNAVIKKYSSHKEDTSTVENSNEIVIRALTNNVALLKDKLEKSYATLEAKVESLQASIDEIVNMIKGGGIGEIAAKLENLLKEISHVKQGELPRTKQSVIQPDLTQEKERTVPEAIDTRELNPSATVELVAMKQAKKKLELPKKRKSSSTDNLPSTSTSLEGKPTSATPIQKKKVQRGGRPRIDHLWDNVNNVPTCPVCQKTYKSGGNVKKHLKNQHPQEYRELDEKSKKKNECHNRSSSIQLKADKSLEKIGPVVLKLFQEN